MNILDAIAICRKNKKALGIRLTGTGRMYQIVKKSHNEHTWELLQYKHPVSGRMLSAPTGVIDFITDDFDVVYKKDVGLLITEIDKLLRELEGELE